MLFTRRSLSYLFAAGLTNWLSGCRDSGDQTELATVPIDAKNLIPSIYEVMGTGLSAAEAAAGVTPANYAYIPGDVRRYGAVGDGLTDSTTAIQNAINQAQQSAGARVYVSQGTYKVTNTLLFSSQNHGVLMYGDSVEQSIIKKTGTFSVINITSSARPTLRDFLIDGVGGNGGNGITVTLAANQFCVDNVKIQNQGNHGIEIIQADLAQFYNVTTLSNGGDGIKLNGTATPDVNACTFTGIDTRGNTGWGFNVANGWANFGTGIVAQSNTAGGIQLDNCRSSFYQIYSESNTGTNLAFTNNANCIGNTVVVLQASTITYGGASASANMVIKNQRGAVFDPNFSKITTDKWILPNGLQDGTAVTGILTASHTANTQFDFIASGVSADCNSVFSNSTGGFYHRIDADRLLLKQAAANCSANQVMLGATTATTVGAAGGASAPPATPSGYLIINVAGTQFKLPYYAN